MSCRVTSLKRMHTLEFRMQQSQLAPEHGATPGLVGSYEVADNWRADGEHFFTFDYQASLVSPLMLHTTDAACCCLLLLSAAACCCCCLLLLSAAACCCCLLLPAAACCCCLLMLLPAATVC